MRSRSCRFHKPSFEFFEFGLTHVVSIARGGSVRLRLCSKDSNVIVLVVVVATAACSKERMCG